MDRQEVLADRRGQAHVYGDWEAMSCALKVAALSDVGCKRKNNEDSFGYDEALQIFVVSDGMGGSAAGEVASHASVKQTLEVYRRMTESRVGLPTHDLLYHSVREANAAVYALAQRNSAMHGMGATLVGACFDGRSAVVANLGDSRAYLLRGELCMQITKDHSFVEEQMRLGLMTREEAAKSPFGTVVTRAMGIAAEAEPDIFAAELLRGDRLLLATDGLMRHVSDSEITKLVQRAGTIETACEWLITLTKERGALDNVTCLLVEMA